MDTTQLLLSTAVTITTILLIVVSIQLISLLKQLKGNIKNDHVVKNPENPPRQSADGGKKDKVIKKKVNLTSLLEKIKILTPYDHSPKKKFFKST
jgi:hypothetical protein